MDSAQDFPSSEDTPLARVASSAIELRQRLCAIAGAMLQFSRFNQLREARLDRKHVASRVASGAGRNAKQSRSTTLIVLVRMRGLVRLRFSKITQQAFVCAIVDSNRPVGLGCSLAVQIFLLSRACNLGET
jgi:hypothetical protein